LCKRLAADIDELLREFTKFTKLEELREFQNNAKAKTTTNRKKTKKYGKQHGGPMIIDPEPSKFSRYTP